ncbi:MAG: molybdopterin-dependent oxidoreductase, partial [Burkholderiales bacterium]|nr:molybdopterin-dependent oxidoreductase [Burkholderiales bacterium]
MSAPSLPSVTKSLDSWRTSSSHWGAFRARTDGRKILEVRPFEGDRDPSPLLASIPAAVHSPNRIAGPSVRKGWLAGRDASDRTQRGREPFVPVSWDQALALVAGELARVRERHGSRAIFNGACGWASAGCFHHARTQAARFLNCGGGHTRHLTNFSFGAGRVLFGRVIGTDAPLWGPDTSWASIAGHTKLMVCFGGLRATNLQVESGGCADHASLAWMRRAREVGVRFVGISPLRTDMPAFLDAEWLSIVPGTDTALLLALIHELVASGRHDREFLQRCCVGSDALLRYLRGEDDGVPKSAHWAERICGVRAGRIRALAGEMAAQRTFISMGWSLQRAD